MSRPFANATWLWNLIDKIGEATSINPAFIKPLLAIQWGWGDTPDAPNWKNIRVGLWNFKMTDSLYYNGMLFIRVMFPFFVGVMIRWGKDSRPSYFQTHIGWKLNGRLAIAFRFQTDTSAAAGMDAPNPGQAVGWGDGGK